MVFFIGKARRRVHEAAHYADIRSADGEGVYGKPAAHPVHPPSVCRWFHARILIWLVAEDTQVKLLLKLLGQWRPVGAHGFQPFKHHPLFVALPESVRRSAFAAGIGPANGWHQKTAEMGFILQFQCAGQPLFCSVSAHQALTCCTSARPIFAASSSECAPFSQTNVESVSP